MMHNNNNKARKHAKSNSTKYYWRTQPSFLDAKQLPYEGDFDHQVENILSCVCLAQCEVDNVQRLLNDLTHTLGCIWPGTQVHPFGSVVTGLSIKNSDVDCYIQVPPGLADCTTKGLVKRAKTTLNKDDNSRFTHIFAITRAKVPIVKFVHVPTGFNCDINFTNFIGIRNSKLIAFLLRLDHRALPLALILKYWSKVYNITGTNLISNYAFSLMVIFYLQVKSVLPSVVELQRQMQSRLVDNWNTAFDDDFTFTCNNTQSLYELLGGFFDYYKSFDYTQLVISPYLGYPAKKQQFKDLNNLQVGYSLYVQNVLSEKCEVLRSNTAVCIQDVFNHSRNCAVALPLKLFSNFQGHVAIVLRIFHERKCDDFLREMFTHKLVYVPKTINSPEQQQMKHNLIVQREKQPISSNKQTDSNEKRKHVHNGQCTPSRVSVQMHDTPKVGYQYCSRNVNLDLDKRNIEEKLNQVYNTNHTPSVSRQMHNTPQVGYKYSSCSSIQDPSCWNKRDIDEGLNQVYNTNHTPSVSRQMHNTPQVGYKYSSCSSIQDPSCWNKRDIDEGLNRVYNRLYTPNGVSRQMQHTPQAGYQCNSSYMKRSGYWDERDIDEELNCVYSRSYTPNGVSRQIQHTPHARYQCNSSYMKRSGYWDERDIDEELNRVYSRSYTPNGVSRQMQHTPQAGYQCNSSYMKHSGYWDERDIDEELNRVYSRSYTPNGVSRQMQHTPQAGYQYNSNNMKHPRYWDERDIDQDPNQVYNKCVITKITSGGLSSYNTKYPIWDPRARPNKNENTEMGQLFFNLLLIFCGIVIWLQLNK